MCKQCDYWEQHESWNRVGDEPFNWNQYWTSELMDTLIRFKLSDNRSMIEIWNRDSW